MHADTKIIIKKESQIIVHSTAEEEWCLERLQKLRLLRRKQEETKREIDELLAEDQRNTRDDRRTTTRAPRFPDYQWPENRQYQGPRNDRPRQDENEWQRQLSSTRRDDYKNANVTETTRETQRDSPSNPKTTTDHQEAQGGEIPKSLPRWARKEIERLRKYEEATEAGRREAREDRERNLQKQRETEQRQRAEEDRRRVQESNNPVRKIGSNPQTAALGNEFQREGRGARPKAPALSNSEKKRAKAERKARIDREVQEALQRRQEFLIRCAIEKGKEETGRKLEEVAEARALTSEQDQTKPQRKEVTVAQVLELTDKKNYSPTSSSTSSESSSASDPTEQVDELEKDYKPPPIRPKACKRCGKRGHWERMCPNRNPYY